MQIGTHTWVIVDGRIPPASTGPKPEFVSHDTVCIVNAGDADAQVELLLIFRDRIPPGRTGSPFPGCEPTTSGSTT